MLRRAVVVVVLGLGLIAALMPEAEAHLAGTIKGIHYSSFECIDEVKGVPGTALGDDPTLPARVQCTVEGKRVEILCQNPQGHDVRPGAAATQITVQASDQLDDSDITNKKKGIATVNIVVSDDPFLDSQFCVNPLWIPIAVLVTDIRVTVDVFQCTTSTCESEVKTSTEVQDCVIPPGFSVVNLPPPGTEYDCVPVSKQHLK
jgi:hypothetical protein